MSHKIDAAQHRRPVDTELIEEKIKELRDDQLSPEQARRLNEIISTIEEALGENRVTLTNEQRGLGLYFV